MPLREKVDGCAKLAHLPLPKNIFATKERIKSEKVLKTYCIFSDFLSTNSFLPHYIDGRGENMSDMARMHDRMINDFSENYMGRLFYFCLRKTGEEDEAEELTQDIALHILSALNRGTVPENFPAWVWQIAHNRYSAWAEKNIGTVCL